MNERLRLRWPPKLRIEKLERLYRSSAEGLLDTELLDDVGITLWLRCEGIVMIARGEFFCPACRAAARLAAGEEEAVCPKCGYKVGAVEYRESFRHRDLWQGNAAACFENFHRRYPRAKTPGERLVEIDALIHSFHIDAKSGLPNRAAANNLIEGSLREVVAALDRLSGVSPESDLEFRRTVDAMWQRRRGGGNAGKKNGEQ